jgi:hypothetical protein
MNSMPSNYSGYNLGTNPYLLTHYRHEPQSHPQSQSQTHGSASLSTPSQANPYPTPSGPSCASSSSSTSTLPLPTLSKLDPPTLSQSSVRGKRKKRSDDPSKGDLLVDKHAHHFFQLHQFYPQDFIEYLPWPIIVEHEKTTLQLEQTNKYANTSNLKWLAIEELELMKSLLVLKIPSRKHHPKWSHVLINLNVRNSDYMNLGQHRFLFKIQI